VPVSEVGYVREGLAHTREYVDRFIAELRRLDAPSWRRLTNCPPWDVQTLAAHVARSAEAYTQALERGSRGIMEPALTPEQRARRQQEIAAQPQGQIMEYLDEAQRQLEQVVEGLLPDRIETQGMHVYGPRDVTWFVQQRLAELAFHLWDLRVSLGLGREFDEDTARWLLPMLVESNLPVLYALAPNPVGAFGLAVEGAPDLAWRLEAGPERMTVQPGVTAPAVIAADAASLALLIYGRARLNELEREGRVRVTGDRAPVDRFWETFRGP